MIPAAHTVAPVYIISERAAAFILEEWAELELEAPSLDLLGNFKLALQYMYDALNV